MLFLLFLRVDTEDSVSRSFARVLLETSHTASRSRNGQPHTPMSLSLRRVRSARPEERKSAYRLMACHSPSRQGQPSPRVLKIACRSHPKPPSQSSRPTWPRRPFLGAPRPKLSSVQTQRFRLRPLQPSPATMSVAV